MTRYEDFNVHPAAELFPLIDGGEFVRLVEDIRTHGLREPIVLHADGSVLDGRNRLRACLEGAVEPRYTTWDGAGSAVDFVISLNLHRRHLSQSQAAMVATKALPLYEAEAKERMLAGVKPEDPTEIFPEGTDRHDRESREQAGEAVGVSGRYVQDAKKIVDEAPDLAEQVETGDLSLPAAKRELKRRKDVETSARREQVKELSAAGHNTDSIAAQLGLTGRTVRDDLHFLETGERRTHRPTNQGQAEREVNQVLTTLASLHHVLPRINITDLDWSLIEIDPADFGKHSRAVSVFIRDFRKEMESHVRPSEG